MSVSKLTIKVHERRRLGVLTLRLSHVWRMLCRRRAGRPSDRRQVLALVFADPWVAYSRQPTANDEISIVPRDGVAGSADTVSLHDGIAPPVPSRRLEPQAIVDAPPRRPPVLYELAPCRARASRSA